MEKKVFLKKNEERRILSGHLWVFSNEIASADGTPENGDLVDVYSFTQKYIASGFYNRNSLIAVRILSYEQGFDINALIRIRLRNSFKLRKELYPERDSFRMVFSESDYLPGLIIDKYNSTFVLQVNSFGFEKKTGLLKEILSEDFNAADIFTRHDPYLRVLEGLSPENVVYKGDMNDQIIDDGKIKYHIKFSSGQKTGFFFDQTDNRTFFERISRGKIILDSFCNSGGFGLHALAAGAASVHFVDSSAGEIESVKRNYALNDFSAKASYTEADVFEFLSEQARMGLFYDVVNIDPPAFTKGKKNLPQAKKGYEKLNRSALRVLKEGGYLVTSSCSHHLDESSFLEIINHAAVKEGKVLRLLKLNSASLDHPRLPAMHETKYLKFAVFKVDRK